MKTKLLLLLLVATSFVKAQNNGPIITELTAINITTSSVTVYFVLNPNGTTTTGYTEFSTFSDFSANVVLAGSFSVNSSFAGQYQTFNNDELLPNTLYYYRVVANNGQGTTTQTISFTTLAPLVVTAPAITAITAITNTNTATISYILNANNGATTSVIRFGLSSTNLSSQVNGFSAVGNSTTSGQAALLGLQTETQYFYQIEATNSAGTTTSDIGSFTTTAFTTAIAEYTFDNTRANIVNTEPFSTATTSFTINRNNIANTALSITASNTGTSAVITGLPVGNSARTISFWYKISANVANSSIFSYGTAATNQTFGMYIQSTGRPTFQAFGTDQIFGTGSYAANTWHHAVISYDGTNVRIYMNGVLTDTKPFSLSTGSSGFKFGTNTAVVSVDDLKIYNEALSQTNITSLYTNNTLTSQNFNQNNLEVSLYPNPANDILNIEMTSEIKSIEIYNIQGQKVKSANQKQINVSDLAAGMYMIRIEDADNAIATKKFVKQ